MSAEYEYILDELKTEPFWKDFERMLSFTEFFSFDLDKFIKHSNLYNAVFDEKFVYVWAARKSKVIEGELKLTPDYYHINKSRRAAHNTPALKKRILKESRRLAKKSSLLLVSSRRDKRFKIRDRRIQTLAKRLCRAFDTPYTKAGIAKLAGKVYDPNYKKFIRSGVRYQLVASIINWIIRLEANNKLSVETTNLFSKEQIRLIIERK